MNFDSLAVIIIMNSESNNLPLDIIQQIQHRARDVTTNSFTLEKVSVINNNINVLEHEIHENLQQSEVILVAGSFRAAATTIFNTLSRIYKDQLVDLQDTYYHCIGAPDCSKVPYYCKVLSTDSSTSIFCMKQVYIIDIDSEKYLACVDYFITSAFKTMRRFVKELYVTQEITNGDLTMSTCNCGEGEIDVSEKKISIMANTLTVVNDMEMNLDQKLRKFVHKRSFVDDYMEKIMKSDEPHVKEALLIIEDCLTQYQPENVFLCFNGGKDCTVLLHLLLCVLRYRFPSYTAPIICLYVENRNPFPEIRTFVQNMAQYYNLEVITQRQGIKESLGSMLEHCSGRMKGCLMGTRKTDPFSDRLNHFHMTDSDWPQIMRVAPVLNWNYGQIWQYLRNYQVPYCYLYDQGYTSLGNVVNTVPNAALQYRNISKNEVTYMPAYKLLDGSLERSGRVVNVHKAS